MKNLLLIAFVLTGFFAFGQKLSKEAFNQLVYMDLKSTMDLFKTEKYSEIKDLTGFTDAQIELLASRNKLFKSEVKPRGILYSSFYVFPNENLDEFTFQIFAEKTILVNKEKEIYRSKYYYLVEYKVRQEQGEFVKSDFKFLNSDRQFEEWFFAWYKTYVPDTMLLHDNYGFVPPPPAPAPISLR